MKLTITKALPEVLEQVRRDSPLINRNYLIYCLYVYEVNESQKPCDHDNYDDDSQSALKLSNFIIKI